MKRFILENRYSLYPATDFTGKTLVFVDRELAKEYRKSLHRWTPHRYSIIVTDADQIAQMKQKEQIKIRVIDCEQMLS